MSERGLLIVFQGLRVSEKGTVHWGRLTLTTNLNTGM